MQKAQNRIAVRIMEPVEAQNPQFEAFVKRRLLRNKPVVVIAKPINEQGRHYTLHVTEPEHQGRWFKFRSYEVSRWNIALKQGETLRERAEDVVNFEYAANCFKRWLLRGPGENCGC